MNNNSSLIFAALLIILIQQVSTSKVETLKVGVIMEETDIDEKVSLQPNKMTSGLFTTTS